MRSTVRSRARRPSRTLLVLLALFAGGVGAHETIHRTNRNTPCQAPARKQEKSLKTMR